MYNVPLDSERSRSSMAPYNKNPIFASHSKSFVEDTSNIRLREKVQTSMAVGQSLVNKYRPMVESNMKESQMAGLPTSQSQVNYMSVR